MEKVKRKYGISLIVLVITILVMIILAGVVVVSLSKNNPIEKAKEANFKTDVSSFASELGVGLSNSLVENSSVKPEEIFANKFVDMKKYINSFSKKYENKLVIADGKLTYIGGDSKEKKWSEECGIEVFRGVNKPVLSEGMIPVKYENNSWVICSENDPSWYNYEQKLWANVMLSDGKYKDKNLIGTKVAKEDLGSMFVWIPRYAYSINKYKTPATGTEGQTQEIHNISFLLGTSNSDIEGKTYPKTYDTTKVSVGNPTPKIVHPAFNFGGEEKNGIWFAKFEASMNEDGTGHTNLNTIESCDFIDEKNSIIKVVPRNITWRYIKIGYAFHNCLHMKDSGNKYGLDKVDTHLMKNIEWGAIANLTTSKYGITPTGNLTFTVEGENKVNIYPGGENNAYEKNISQSTTGNVTGIYDMNGGSGEYVATYFANNNSFLSGCGGEILFAGNKLNPQYEKYFDKNETPSEENNPGTHSLIWNSNYNDSKYGNVFKKKISDGRYNLSSSNLGDGIFENTNLGEYSFWGKKTNNESAWIKSITDTQITYGNTVYNSDIALLGNTVLTFLVRGGDFSDNKYAGIFGYGNANGGAVFYRGFRPVIVNN